MSEDFQAGDRFVSFPSPKHPGEFLRGTILGKKHPVDGHTAYNLQLDGDGDKPITMRATTVHRWFRKLDLIERLGELA